MSPQIERLIQNFNHRALREDRYVSAALIRSQPL
jgi:hypothetical protein